jgi:signal transduction histidine kinase/CheY-like chemotaxis protein/HAMP domain-containing protein
VDDASRNRGPSEPIHTGDLKLPELAYYVTTLRIAQPPTMTELRRKWEQVLQTYSDVRFSPKGANPGVLLCRGGSVDRVREAAQDLRERLGATVDYDEPFRCETFAVTMKVVRPEGGSAVAAAPPWFVLGLAVATEEFEHEIQVAHRRNLWLTLAISGGAALAALGFAFYLTRPLRQMIGYAERIAAGQEPETELEVPKGHAKDELGTLARAFSSMVDQIRVRTRELRESEARIRTILNTAAEGIVTIDEQGHLESFNLAAERLFGYQAAEVRGKHFTKLLGRGAPTHLPTLFGFGSGSPTLGGGSPFASFGAESSLMSISRVNGTTREVMARRKNGSGFPAEMSVSEVILGDRLVYTAILRDVTERKQAQQASERMTVELERRVAERTAELMQANQALESARDLALEANRAKDAFLAVMSHELRTPLNAIIGYCDYWLGEADEFDTNEMRDDMRKMHVSGKHLLTLINDILDLAKIQAGKVTLDLSDFEIGGLLSELQEWVQPLVRKNNNTLTVEADANLGAMRADRTRVRQVLLNLLSNASKFTQSGAIRLHVQRSRAAGREEIVFRVSDTGVGMKPEDVRKLFRETFFQADSSSTRKHEGTGLGLVICHKLCKLMGGDVEVQSTLGVGTTFTVRLPTVVTPALPGDRPAPSASTNETATMQWQVATVLVIDDDINSRKMLERILRREGYAVRTASAGAEAVKLAREIEPAAIVLDALAPNKDGWSALAALKADSRTADIPIIMATIVDDQSRGFALGGTDFITKPIDWDRLGVLLRPYRSAQTSSPILVVDDDESTRSMTHRHLAAQGWHVVEASNGREALERLAGTRPAVILLDLMMPEMDGFQFVERLQRDETWRTIPVVVVTAIDLTAADRQRLNGSVQQILQKGAHTPEQLLSAIRDRLNQCIVPR